jgi:DNA-binding transcriptional regulator YiaG
MRMKKYEKKPFPWRCGRCGEQAVYGAIVDYTTTEYHGALPHTVTIAGLKTPKCAKCGQVAPDLEARDAITAAFMRQINLLMPAQIREHRLKANLTEHELAAALGVADDVVAKMENGDMIQSRTLDNLMRLFFGLAQVREILTT